MHSTHVKIRRLLLGIYLTFYHMGTGNQTQVLKLGRKYFWAILLVNNSSYNEQRYLNKLGL